MVARGGVRVDGRVERRAGFVVRTGARVEAEVRGGEQKALPVPPADLVVLFEDPWLLAVDKPAGVPTHATLDPGRSHLHAMVQALLAARHAPGPDSVPYVGIHHRLDRDTSGVVLFTVDRAANPGMAALFAGRAIEKRYVALVQGNGQPPSAWEVRDHLGPVGRVGKTTRFGAVRSGGDPAHSEFRTLAARGSGRWLVEGVPHTGRTHQLRVHLAASGVPIVGDRLYGGPPGERVLLHARSLRFTHPLTGAAILVEAPVPVEVDGPVTRHGERRRPLR